MGGLLQPYCLRVLFVHGSPIIKLDCFEFLTEGAWSLKGVRSYVQTAIISEKKNLMNRLYTQMIIFNSKMWLIRLACIPFDFLWE